VLPLYFVDPAFPPDHIAGKRKRDVTWASHRRAIDLSIRGRVGGDRLSERGNEDEDAD